MRQKMNKVLSGLRALNVLFSRLQNIEHIEGNAEKEENLKQIIDLVKQGISLILVEKKEAAKRKLLQALYIFMETLGKSDASEAMRDLIEII